MIDLKFLYSDERHKLLLNRNNYYHSGKISFKVYEKGIILPCYKDIFKHDYDGVWSNDRVYDKGSGHNATINDVHIFERVFPNVEVKKVKEKVLYIGNFSGCWGHFITDSIRLLWFLETDDFKEKYKDYKKIFISWKGFKLVGNYKKILSYCGLDTNELIEIKEPTQFDEIVLPDSSFYFNDGTETRFFSQEYIKTIDKIISNVVLNGKNYPEKIYYSCSKKPVGDSIGEEKLEKFFKKQGFTILYPENYTIDEQINFMQHCKVFASTDGSSMHNCIFCKDETKLLIIPRAPYSSGYQDALNYTRNFNITYIDSSLSIFAKGNELNYGPFYYYVSKELLTYFGVGTSKNYIFEQFYDINKYIDEGIYRNAKDCYFYDKESITRFIAYYSKYKKIHRISVLLFKVKRKIKQLVKKVFKK